MRTFVMTATTIVLLLGCDSKIAKVVPRPLAKTAKFELYIVSPIEGANTKTEADPETGAKIYLTTPAVITTADVMSVSLEEDTQDQKRLNVNLTPVGSKKLSAATAPPSGMRVAIVANDKIVSAPTVRTTLSDSVSISGSKSTTTYDELTKE